MEFHSLSDADQQAVMEKLSGSWNLFVFGLRKNQRVTRLSTAMPGAKLRCTWQMLNHVRMQGQKDMIQRTF